MSNYFIADRKVTSLTMVVTVGGAPVSKDTVSSYRPFYALGFVDLSQMKLPTISNKKLDGILRRQTDNRVVRNPIRPIWSDFRDVASKQYRDKNPQAFCNKSTQFILRNIGAEISFSTAKEILGNPTRKGKLLVWPEATFEQEVVMVAIDQCHDRCNGAIYNGIITIGNQEIKIKDYLRRAE